MAGAGGAAVAAGGAVVVAAVAAVAGALSDLTAVDMMMMMMMNGRGEELGGTDRGGFEFEFDCLYVAAFDLFVLLDFLSLWWRLFGANTYRGEVLIPTFISDFPK